MSRHPSDSFLPSGAVEAQRVLNGRHGSMISPMSQTPRTIPSAELSPLGYHSKTTSPIAGSKFSPSQHPPISPPKTRPESAEESAAVMVENYRSYTATLRAQAEGERVHMIVDRARMEEVMAEERALWDEERLCLKSKIAELEAALEKKSSQPMYSPQANNNHQRPTSHPRISSMGSNTGSMDSVRSVPQESGRNADGSPFYAPAPRKPSRTFDTSGRAEMRIDDITAPRETPICVTSKELTSSDFVHSPSSTSAHEHMEIIKESPSESIDIQLIQPELEGVSIKASAVTPAFAARVLSPRRLTPKVSPDLQAPRRDVTNSGGRLSPEEKQQMMLDIACQPENRRLTMHAGHTPSHSMSFPILLGTESGEATPKPDYNDDLDPKDEHIHRPSLAVPTGYVEPSHTVDQLSPLPESEDETDYATTLEHETGSVVGTDTGDNGDRSLTGILGLTSNSRANDAFLNQLSKKLEVVARNSRDASPSNASSSERSLSPEQSRTKREEDDEVDEGKGDEVEAPRLRLKPSMNFGRPMGSM